MAFGGKGITHMGSEAGSAPAGILKGLSTLGAAV